MNDRARNIADDSVPRIGQGFRLQYEPVQNAHVLLYPEGMVTLNRSAGEILSRCDGATTVQALVSKLEAAFDRTDLKPEVFAFLETAYAQRWVELG